MSKLYVLGIGGTGERVLRSLTMIMASGVPAFDNYEVYPIIIDYDANCGAKNRKVKLLKTYTDITGAAYRNHGLESAYKPDMKDATSYKNYGKQFFGSPMKEEQGLKNYTMVFKLPNTGSKYADYIGKNNLQGDTFNSSLLLESLYDTSNDTTAELNLDMKVRFRGNPNVGSVVLDDLKKSQTIRNMMHNYNADTGDRIIIIGSLFGGTGASGIPALVQSIYKINGGAHIATVLVLPYFYPCKADGSGGTILPELFNAKTKAAINYYQSSKINEKIRNIYYVGDFYPTHIDYREGLDSNDIQENNANIIEFIAAMSVVHFAGQQELVGTNQNYKFSITKDIAIKSTKEGKKNINIIYSKDFTDELSQKVIKNMLALASTMKFYHDSIINGGKAAERLPYFHLLGLDTTNKTQTIPENAGNNNLERVCANMNNFYEELVLWMNEMNFAGNANKHQEGNSHRLALYNLSLDYSKMILAEETAEAVRTRTILGFGGRSDRTSSLTESEMKGLVDTVFDAYCEKGDLKEVHKQKNKAFVLLDILHWGAIEATKDI